MTFGFQEVVRLANTFRVTGPGHEVWELPDPVGAVRVAGLVNADAFGASAEVRIPEVRQGEELTFYGSGFRTAGDAIEAGKRLVSWLRVTSALRDLGFDVGNGTQQTFLPSDGAALVESQLDSEDFLVDDVHGLITFEERGRARRFKMRLHVVDANVLMHLSADQVRVALQYVAASVAEISDSDALACDLLSSIPHLARDDAKFLTCFYALEALVEQAERTGDGRAWIDAALADLSSQSGWSDLEDLASLTSAVDGLKNASMRSTLIRIAREMKPAESGAEVLIRTAYKLRNERVHAHTTLTPLGDTPGRLTEFTKEVLAARVGLALPVPVL